MNLFNLSATLTVDTSNYSSKIKSAASETDSFGSQTSSATSPLSNLGIMFANVAANYITQFISKIEEAISSVYEIGTATETAYAKLETIAGTENIDDLTDSLEDLSVQSGISSADLAETAYQAISAGTSAEDAAEMVEIAGKLATGGFTDSTTAVDVLTTAINAYGYSAEDAEAIADSLIQTQNLGKTTVDELASGMGKAIASGSAYGVSLGNIEAAYVGMTSQGIDTAEATTYMNSMIKELGDSSSDVASIIQDETGQSFSELMDSGYSLADVLQILYDNCDGDTTALQNLWSSSEAGLAANALVSDGLDDFNENLEAIENSSGTTEEAYATMSDTLSFKTSTMQTSFQALALQLYDKVEPALSAMVDAVTDYVIPALQWCIDNAPVIITLITGIAAAIAVLEAGSIAKKISSVTTSATKLFSTLLGNPLAIVVVAVAALVAAFIYLWNNCEAFRDFFLNLWEAIKTAVSNAKESLSSTLENIKEIFSAVVTGIQTAIANVKESLSATLEDIKEIFSAVVTGIQTAIANAKEVISTVLTAIQNVFTTVWNAIQNVVSTVFNVIQTIISTYLNVYLTIITTVWNTIKTVVTTVLNAIKEIISTIITAIQTIISGDMTSIKDVFSTIWNAIKSIVSTVINAIKSVISTVMSAIKTVITAPLNAISSLFSSTFSGIKTKVTSALSSIKSTVSSWGSNLKSMFTSIGKNLISGLWSGISDKVDWVISKIKSLGSSITKAIKSVFGIASPSKVFAGVGDYLVQGLAQGIDETSGEAIGATEDMAASVTNAMTGASLGISDFGLSSMQAQSSGLSLQDMIAEAVSSQVDRILAVMQEYYPQFGNEAIYLDGDTLVSGTVARMDVALSRRSTRKARG